MSNKKEHLAPWIVKLSQKNADLKKLCFKKLAFKRRLFYCPQNTGRSMIEMLGVLAVIGVLSVAALAGFQYAMNKHRANETIHDVMLRAANVPMEYEDYDQPHWVGKEYLFPSLENQSGTLSTMGYPMKTYRDTAFGYVYRVDVTSVPEKVCTKILRLEPTDIDEIRIGASGQPYTRGAWDLCKNQPANEALMVFLFEKHCQTDSDCSACQRCLQGRCKADYGRTGCDGSVTPTTPPLCVGADCNPDGTCSGSDCTICVGKDCDENGHCVGEDCHSCTGSDCGPDGECEGPDCTQNPPTPPVICVGADCNPDGTCSGSDCTICVGKDCDENGHCVGEDCHSCTGSDCGPDGECEGPDCIDNPPTPPLPEPDDSCTSTTTYQYGDKCQYTAQCCTNPVAENCPPVCVSKDCPVPPVCTDCQIKTFDTNGCHSGCQDTSCCPAPTCEAGWIFNEENCTCLPVDCLNSPACGACEKLNSETCSCEPIPGCSCPAEPVCGACEDYTYDENHCPVACVQKECSDCPAGTKPSADTDACGCSRCIPDDCDTFPGCGTCQDVQYDSRDCPVGCTTKPDTCCGMEEIRCPGECEQVVTDANGCAKCEADYCCLYPDADECRCTLECTEPCTQLNSETCSCEPIPGCSCPAFNGCLSCQTQTVDKNNCPVCIDSCTGACQECTENGCEDRTVKLQSGTCCDAGEGTCCPLTDTCDVCVIQDMEQCACEEGYQRTPFGECLECPIMNLATGNHYEICQHADGRYACCCVGGGENWNVKQDDSGECILCEPPKIFNGYDECVCGDGQECGINCCTDGDLCINNSACCPAAQVCDNELFSICCQTGETCINASCCAEEKACGNVCCNDGEICLNGGCSTPCPDDKPVSCQAGADTWCCATGNTCGSTAGQCCLGGNCCEGTIYNTATGVESGFPSSDYLCCPSPKVVIPTAVSQYGAEGYTCCPKGDVFIQTIDTYRRVCYSSGECSSWTYEPNSTFADVCSSELICNPVYKTSYESEDWTTRQSCSP